MSATGSLVEREIVFQELEWKIDNFTLHERSYWSPEFTFHSKIWKFAVLPNPSDGYIGLFLWRKSIDSPMSVEFSVALKTSDGQKSFERGGTEIFDEGKFSCMYRWMRRNEFERRKTELLSSGCLAVIITLKRVDFVDPARRRHFFRLKYIPMNNNTSAPISHEGLNISTTRDAVQNENVSQEFEWKIDNFSLTERSYWSPQFTVRSETWKFVMFPNLSDGYIQLRIRRNSLGSPLLVELSFALKTSDGQKSFERGGPEIFDEWKRECLYRWMRRTEFQRQQIEFLTSGCLTIIITLKIVDAVQPARCTGCELKNRILQNYKEMFLSQQNCDVVLRVRGQDFSAHKNILAAQSPVFESTFRNNMREKETGIVEIEDIDPTSFPEFLSFVYSGEMESIFKENVHNLFAAADKYIISDLRNVCLQYMHETISLENFFETLVLALLHNENDLNKACTNFFVQNAQEIIESDKWETFAAENPKESRDLFLKYVKSMNQSKN